MTTSPLNKVILHNAAVALNNIGVTLLQRHCYREALGSFKNAFKLLKVCLQNELLCESIYTTMNASLIMASGQLINAFQTTERVQKNDGFSLTVLSYDQYRDFQALKDAANSYESDFMGYVIIICPDESEQNITTQSYITNLKTESAIVLNNMTTTCMSFGYRSSCNKIDTTSNKKRIQLYQKGLELGTTAYDVLSRQLIHERDLTTSRYQSALSILVLKNLMRIAYILNDIPKSQEFYMMFSKLRADAAFIEENYIDREMFQSFLAPVA